MRLSLPDEEDPGLAPPSTAPPRLEESGSTKRTRGRTLDFTAQHTGTVSKKGKPWDHPEGGWMQHVVVLWL
jgi:hypothetical protein